MKKLKRTVFALLLGLWLSGASAQTVRIGIVNTFSGPQASFGEMNDRAMKLYITSSATMVDRTPTRRSSSRRT